MDHFAHIPSEDIVARLTRSGTDVTLTVSRKSTDALLVDICLADLVEPMRHLVATYDEEVTRVRSPDPVLPPVGMT